jgi:ribose transport system permease protein
MAVKESFEHTPKKREPVGRGARRFVAEQLGLLLVLFVLVAAFSLTTGHFLSLTTFRTIANQIPDALVIAVGMTFVLLIGGIDLSVGSVLALGSAALGVCLVDWKLPLPAAIIACLLVGLMCGLVNGLVTVRWALPSFIVTLGMLEVARGGAYLLTHSQTKYVGASVERVTQFSIFGLSLPILFAVALVFIAQFVLTRTLFGRYVMAVGANEEAARFAGISVKPVKVAVFALSGCLSAVAAVIHSARLASSDPNAGTGFELNAIAAVVIGGTSLMGGRGSVVSSFLGVLIIAVLGAGLAQVGAQEPTKRLVTGCVIVVAAVVDYYRT